MNISVMSIGSSVPFKVIVFSLILYLNGLSIDSSGLLKSPTIIVLLLISFIMFDVSCFMYLGSPMLRGYIFKIVRSSFWIIPLIIV